MGSSLQNRFIVAAKATPSAVVIIEGQSCAKEVNFYDYALYRKVPKCVNERISVEPFREPPGAEASAKGRRRRRRSN